VVLLYCPHPYFSRSLHTLPKKKVRPCSTSPCPKDPLGDFMADCKLSDPRGVAAVAREALGATDSTDLFELDAGDLEELGLKVKQ